jgi:hypothetical protein
VSDLEFLYVLLAAFYLWECLGWVRRGGVVFVRRWGRASRIAPLVGNQRGGFALAHPLPPLGSLAVAAQLPVSVSEEGVLAYVAAGCNPAGRPLQTGRFVRWEDVKSLTARGKSVRANEELLVLAQSTLHARWLAAQLQALAKAPRERRGAAAEQLIAATFDRDALQARWTECETRARAIRGLANVLLVFVFVVAPVLVWRLGIELAWPWLVAGLFALTGTIAVLFRRAHRSLYPDAEEERFSQFLTVLLFSPAAMRAHDMLARPLLERFHPLAVAAALCDSPGFQRFARLLLLDLRNPVRPLATDGNPPLAALEAASRARTLAAAEQVVRATGADPAELTRPPAPLDATCRAFCPRCHAQFTSVDLACTDCGGLPVQGFGV